MLHNKHLEILNLFTGDYSKKIYGRELIGKINQSQKGIALTLSELEHMSILKSEKKGNLKLYTLNLELQPIKDILITVELAKKVSFLGKHKKLAHILKGDKRIVGIFGSYAKGTAKPHSDIDLFIIGEKVKDDYNKKGDMFDLNISVKYFSEKDFCKLLREKNNLVLEIVQNHVLINNTERFINLVWRYYYGLD